MVGHTGLEPVTPQLRVGCSTIELMAHKNRDDGLARLVEQVINQILEAQATEQLKAAPYERTEERQVYRNGHLPRLLKSRVGELNLQVARVRKGSFSTDLFERYQP